MSPRQGNAESVADGLRTPAEVLQQATRVTASSTAGSRRLQQRMAEAPPGVESFQTENQRRRALPLSQLKRAKPKRRCARGFVCFGPCKLAVACNGIFWCDFTSS